MKVEVKICVNGKEKKVIEWEDKDFEETIKDYTDKDFSIDCFVDEIVEEIECHLLKDYGMEEEDYTIRDGAD